MEMAYSAKRNAINVGVWRRHKLYMQQLGFRAEFITFWCSNQVARLSFVTALFLISPCKCDILLLRVYKETTNKYTSCNGIPMLIMLVEQAVFKIWVQVGWATGIFSCCCYCFSNIIMGGQLYYVVGQKMQTHWILTGMMRKGRWHCLLQKI